MPKSTLYKTRGWALIEPYLKMADSEFKKERASIEDKLKNTDEKLMPVQAARYKFAAEMVGDAAEMRNELVEAGWTAPN